MGQDRLPLKQYALQQLNGVVLMIWNALVNQIIILNNTKLVRAGLFTIINIEKMLASRCDFSHPILIVTS